MSKNQLVIGVCGGSGSGKTTFVNKLKESIDSPQLCFLSLDNYYKPREEQQEDSSGYKNFDLPDSIDIGLLIKDLETLMSGQKVQRTEYTFNNNQSVAQEITLRPSKVYIIEGLFIYHYPELQKYFDLKLFVEAKDVLKVLRRIRRDKSERNYPISDVSYRYQNHVLPSYEKYIKVYRDDCDIIINNNDSFDRSLDVVASYIKNQLKNLI
ncbi:uridine kinase [Saprospiraceae bacterium]|nr:uridine kinase [Saprospiraceae bacterium]